MVAVAYPVFQTVTPLGSGAERMRGGAGVFDAPPKPVNEDVVLASAVAVHADGDVVVLENLGEAITDQWGISALTRDGA